MTTSLTLALLDGELAICRLDASASLPTWAVGAFVAVTRTPDELSVVCGARHVPDDATAARGWRALRVEGPLPLDLVGIFVAIGTPLAVAGISIFPIATHDTDWVLVPAARLADAIDALVTAGHRVLA